MRIYIMRIINRNEQNQPLIAPLKSGGSVVKPGFVSTSGGFVLKIPVFAKRHNVMINLKYKFKT